MKGEEGKEGEQGEGFRTSTSFFALKAVPLSHGVTDNIAGWSDGGEWFRGQQCASVGRGVRLLSAQADWSFSDRHQCLSHSESCRQRCH